MMMQILDYGRGLGKTFECIRRSLSSGRHILVATQQEKELITKTMAGDKRLAKLRKPYKGKLPEVYTLADLRQVKNKDDLTNMIIDEAPTVLEYLLREYGVSVGTITLSSTEISDF